MNRKWNMKNLRLISFEGSRLSYFDRIELGLSNSLIQFKTVTGLQRKMRHHIQSGIQSSCHDRYNIALLDVFSP